MELEPGQAIQDEIIRLAEVDRIMREGFIAGSSDWDDSVDAWNTARLQTIIETHGWPAISLVGEEASHAAGMLALHTTDLQFMTRCLMLMEMLPAGEVAPIDVAYLEDRVLVLYGHPQIYGTQFYFDHGVLKVSPIRDAELVDERRASVGLDSFANNVSRIYKMYGHLQREA